MKSYIIDKYHYCNPNDKEKEEYYRNHTLTEEEQEKTDEICKKIDDFIIKTEGEDDLRIIHNYCFETSVHYREGVGYISIINADRDDVDVYFFGTTLEEAFLNVIVDMELSLGIDYECAHRQELNKDFSERFLGGKYSPDDYHGPFFFGEYALKNLRKYYGDNIPEVLVDYYESYVSNVEHGNYKYDYETNQLISVEKKIIKE